MSKSTSSGIKAEAQQWKIFNFPNNPSYDKVFKISVNTSPTGPIYDNVTIVSSNGQYSGNSPENVVDGNPQTHWEPQSAIPEGKSINLTLTFKTKTATFSRVVYAARSDAGNKGFPLEYEIHGTDANDENSLRLIHKGTFLSTDASGKMVEIWIPKTTFKIFRFSFLKATGNYPSCSTLAFYTEDKVDDFSDKLFTDGTWSQLAITKTEAQTFLESYKSHPLKESYMKKAEVLQEVIADIGKGELLKRVFEIENRSPGKLGSMQLGQSFPEFIPLGIYAQSLENFEIFADIPKGMSSQLVFMKFLDKKGDFISKANLYNNYNAVKANDYSDSESRSMVAYVTASSAGVSKEEGKPLPKLRIKGGMNCPFYYKTRGDNLDKFEQDLRAYIKNVVNDNSVFNQSKIITEYNYDIAVARHKDNTIFTTARGLLSNIETNKQNGNTLNDALDLWQDISDGFLTYLGTDENDPLECHHQRKGMLYSVMIAQAGKPFAWSDGFFTGYNNNDYKGKGNVTGGWINSVLVYKDLRNGGWGYYHEWGHSHDNGKIKITETTNNMFSLYFQRKYEYRLNRLSTDGRYKQIYSQQCIGKNLDVFQKLALLRKVEILSEVGKPIEWFFPHFFRWLRENKYNPGTVKNDTPENWFYATSKFMGINFFPILTNYNFTVPESIKQELSTLIQIKKACLYTDERFWVVRNQLNGTRIDKEKAKVFIKQVYVHNVDLKLTLGIDQYINQNEFDEIIGYEFKDAQTRELINMVQECSIPLKIEAAQGYQFASPEINYIITPITLKLERMRPFRLTGRFVFNTYPKNGWKIESYPYDVKTKSGNIANVINSDPKSCYVTEEYDGDHGFIIDMGKNTTLYGFRDIASKEDLGGFPEDVHIYLSFDNITYTEYSIPNYPNATGMYNTDKKSPKYKWDSRSEPFQARYIKVVAQKSSDGSTKFQSCEFGILSEPNTFKITYDVDDDADYIQSLKETKLYPDTSIPPPTEPATSSKITEPGGDDSQDGNQKKGSSSNVPIIIGVVIAVLVVAGVVIGIVIYLKKRNSGINNNNLNEASTFDEKETNLEI